MFDDSIISDFFVLFKNSQPCFMHLSNHGLFTWCQQHFSTVLVLKLELNLQKQNKTKKTHDAAYCMRSDNQEDSSVYHYFGITNGKEVLEMISAIPEQQAFFPVNQWFSFLMVEAITWLFRRVQVTPFLWLYIDLFVSRFGLDSAKCHLKTVLLDTLLARRQEALGGFSGGWM